MKNIYDKDSLELIRENIKNVNVNYIFICILLLITYFVLQGIYMKSILKALNYDISVKKGIFYSLIEFYFSGITPSSTGGQPVQLYYMTKDKIPIRKSYITLMLNTIYFKLIILIFGILVLLVNNTYVFDGPIIYRVCFFLGFLVDFIIVLLGFFLLFKTSLIEFLYAKLTSFLRKFKIFKKKLKSDNNEVMERYKDEIHFIKNHKMLVFITFVITFIQRLALFSIIYVIYKALGYSGYSYLDLLIIQLSVQTAIEALPLPGGAGLSESMLHNIFTVIFSVEMADVGMLLTRTFTFYVPLLASGLIILIQYILSKRKKNNN